MRASEEWRTDPERLATARARVEQVQTDLERVKVLLDEALAISRTWSIGEPPRMGLGGYLHDLSHKIFSAQYRLDWWIRQGRETLDDPTKSETYLGNIAAFGGHL